MPTTSNIYGLTDTWDDGATTFVAIQMDVTDTASAAASKLIDLQKGSVSQFNVDKDGNLTLAGTVDGRDVAADGTKLDGIEAGADVTDTDNVRAANALMDDELTSEASVKALNQGVATTDSPTFAGATLGSLTVTSGTLVADIEGDVTGTVSSLSNHTTDNLSQGSTNQYYADSLVDSHLNQANPTDGHVLSWTSGDYAWVPQSGGSGSGITVQDEGSALTTTATTLNFVGTGVTASGTGATKTVIISEGGRRNLITNGTMQVAQRGVSETGITTSGYYTVDRFRLGMSSLGTWTQTQEADGPDGIANSLKVECTTADASPGAGDFFMMTYKIEGQDLQHLKKGTSSAESTTLSFWVKSNKTGTYVAELQDADNSNRHIGKSFTVNSSGTWEYKTVTFEGDTTGTLDNDNLNSLTLILWLGSGSNYNSGTLQTSWGVSSDADRAVGNVNLADTTGNYFQITGVQLEVGETATPLEYRPYGEELALCKRYYQVVGYSTAGQQDASYNTDHFHIPYNAMRAEPTVDAFTFSKEGHISGSLSSLGGGSIVYHDNAIQLLWSSSDSKYRNHGYRATGSISLTAEL